MEEGKNEIMELRQMIEGCFERQNKLIARLEMELEALSSFNGKQMLDSRDMRLQLKVCDRTLIRWRMSGKRRIVRLLMKWESSSVHPTTNQWHATIRNGHASAKNMVHGIIQLTKK